MRQAYLSRDAIIIFRGLNFMITVNEHFINSFANCFIYFVNFDTYEYTRFTKRIYIM